MTTGLMTMGFARVEEAVEGATASTTRAKAPPVFFSCVRRRRRENNVLSVLVVLLISGCNDGAQLSVNEYYELSGVQDVEAPNRVLFEWSRPGVAQAPRGGPVDTSLSGLFEGDKRNTLDLVNVELTDAIRAELRASHEVKWLRLPATIRASDLDWIGQMKQLRGLSLNGADLRGADFRTLESLSGLQWLNLYGAKMDEADIATLPSLRELESLNLGHSGLTDNGIRHLISLELPSLEALSLSDAKISDDGMEQLCAKYQLRCLNLYSVSNVTKRSVDAIGRMNTLRSLGVGLSGISPHCRPNPDVKRLQKLLPRCVVDYGD